MVRQCVTDNGENNEETEIARSNHCGLVNMLRYDDKMMQGCMVSCKRDGCNDSGRPLASYALILAMIMVAVVRRWCFS